MFGGFKDAREPYLGVPVIDWSGFLIGLVGFRFLVGLMTQTSINVANSVSMADYNPEER